MAKASQIRVNQKNPNIRIGVCDYINSYRSARFDDKQWSKIENKIGQALR